MAQTAHYSEQVSEQKLDMSEQVVPLGQAGPQGCFFLSAVLGPGWH